MMALWMVYAVLLGLAVSVVALAAEYALRLYGRSTRWLWATSLGAVLVLPLVVLLLAPVPRTSALLVPDGIGEVMPMAPAELPPAAVARPSLSARLAALESRAEGALPWLWLGGSLLALLGVAISYARLRRERASWREGQVDGVPVLFSPGIGPAVVGLRRSRIVVPEWVLQEPEARRRMILAHEAEHIAAGDPRLLTSALLAIVAAPWNPLVWWQLHRLRLAAELDCDARVLRRGNDLRGYAGLLLDVGMRFAEGAPLAAFAEPRSFLARRLRMLTAPLPPRRGWRVAGVLAGAALAVAAGCIAPRPARPASLIPSFGRAAVRAPAPAAATAAPAAARPLVAVVDTPPPAPAETTKVTAPDLSKGPAYTPYDVAPELTNRDEVRAALIAAYPPLLKSAGIGGRGDFWALVDRQGSVLQARVRNSTGRAELDSAALSVVKKMRFTPASNRGQVTEVWITLPIVFKTTGAPAVPGETPPPGPTPTREQILAGPTFTPYTVAPALANREEVRAALVREYPPAAKAAGDSGTVLVWALIDEKGAVEKSQVRKTSGKPEFDTAAVHVAYMMRFAPAQHLGQPVMVWVMLPIIFRSTAQEADARAKLQAKYAAEYAGLPPGDSKYGIPGLPEGYSPPDLVNGREVSEEYRAFYPQGVQAPHWAWVKVAIAADGSTSGFALARSSGNVQVDALALSLAQKLRFRPAHDAAGKPASITGYLPFPNPNPPAPAPKDSGAAHADAGKRVNVAALVAPIAAAVVVHK